MELVKPAIGLLFWMLISFGALLFILSKFAWPAITKALKEREKSIEEALHLAETARGEMKKLKFDNEQLLKEAKEERDAILKDARKIKDSIVNEAHNKAHLEYERMIEVAREGIKNEKMAAITELKNQLAILSIEVAEKILREELSKDKKQDQYVKSLVDEMKFN
ncbi:MAG: F0F1 ATP synthase subunit B [Bacteroidales bacterium]|jgi:F-type H+-transporting ATPase subunit b|nr:F0F1 ATP synthase subunit B [Bacteroidales bacterium]